MHDTNNNALDLACHWCGAMYLSLISTVRWLSYVLYTVSASCGSFVLEIVWKKRISVVSLTLEASKKKIVTWSLEGGGGNRIPPSTFDIIHPIDMLFGTYNKLYLFFQLSETKWCLIGFHGSNSKIKDVTVGRLLGFLHFQILLKFLLLYLKLTRKEHLTVEIHKIVRIHQYLARF